VRNQRVHNQLVRCLMVEADLLRMVYSKDALVATTTELRRTTDALRTLANKRQDIFYTAGARAHDGRTFSQPGHADDSDGVDAVSTNSTVARFIPDPSKYANAAADNLMNEVYGHTAMAYRKSKGLPLDHIMKAMKGAQNTAMGRPPPGY
jgi:GDP-D-mannose dehydratase